MGLLSDFEWCTSYRHEDGDLIELFYNPAIPLRHVSEECALETLHRAAKTGREPNTGAACRLIEDVHVAGDATLPTALEALLNLLPPGVTSTGREKPGAILTGAANDFEALERRRKLAFSETVPAPKIPEQIPLELASGSEESGEDGDTPGPV